MARNSTRWIKVIDCPYGAEGEALLNLCRDVFEKHEIRFKQGNYPSKGASRLSVQPEDHTTAAMVVKQVTPKPDLSSIELELDRAFIIFVCKDGTVTFKPKGQPPFNGIALPVHSVDTIAEAVQVQVTLCRKQYTSHPKLGKEPWYTLTNFDGEIDSLAKVAQQMQAVSAKIRARQGAARPYAELGDRPAAISEDVEGGISISGGREAQRESLDMILKDLQHGLDGDARRIPAVALGSNVIVFKKPTL